MADLTWLICAKRISDEDRGVRVTKDSVASTCAYCEAPIWISQSGLLVGVEHECYYVCIDCGITDPEGGE